MPSRKPPAKSKATKKRAAPERAKPMMSLKTTTSRRNHPSASPRLLSGDNPQISKADGDAPVQAYIAAVPGWKQQVCRDLDGLISKTVPKLRKAVKWNTPLYGVDSPVDAGAKGLAREWFMSFHCFAKYVKVGFFRGSSLRPPPPGESTQKEVRYLNIREGEWGTTYPEARVAGWIKQASELPGEWL